MSLFTKRFTVKKEAYFRVIVDNETGVNYLQVEGGGLCVLVDADGKPIVTKEE